MLRYIKRKTPNTRLNRSRCRIEKRTSICKHWKGTARENQSDEKRTKEMTLTEFRQTPKITLDYLCSFATSGANDWTKSNLLVSNPRGAISPGTEVESELLKMDRNTPNSLRRVFGRRSSKFTQFLLRRRNAASVACFAFEIDAERRRRCFNRRSTAGELWKLPSRPIRNRLAVGNSPAIFPACGTQDGRPNPVFRRSYKYCRFRVAVFRHPTVRKRGPPGGPTFLEAPPDTNSSATCGKTKHGNPTSGPTSHGHPFSSCTSQQAIRNVSSPSILFFRKNNSAVVHLQTRETPGPSPPFPVRKQI